MGGGLIPCFNISVVCWHQGIRVKGEGGREGGRGRTCGAEEAGGSGGRTGPLVMRGMAPVALVVSARTAARCCEGEGGREGGTGGRDGRGEGAVRCMDRR